MTLKIRLLRFFLVVFIGLSLPQMVFAQDVPACKFTASDPDGDGWGLEHEVSCRITENSSVPGGGDWTQLNAFLSKSVSARLRQGHVPGAAIAVVKDGKILLAEGYGYADYENKSTVSADKTQFRVASISKTFTALAILKLVSEGKLYLNQDVLSLLGEPGLEHKYSETLTLQHLLTHSSGFDLTDIGDASKTLEGVKPLSTLLPWIFSTQSRPPAQFYQYANQNFVLAGLIIERISDEHSFDSFMDQNILKPLGMSGSTFKQDALTYAGSSVAKGYIYQHGRHITIQPNFSNVGPADGLVATAKDMGAYLRYLTSINNNDEDQFISKKYASLLFEKQYPTFDDDQGVSLGWNIDEWEGYKIIQHTGGVDGFTSHIFLIPELDVGFFIALNMRNTYIREVIAADFLNEYLPEKQKNTVMRPQSKNNLIDTEKYLGQYVKLLPDSNFERLFFLLGADAKGSAIVSSEMGLLKINSNSVTHVENDLFAFSEEPATRNKPSLVQFIRDQEHNIKYFKTGRDTYERIQWWESPQLNGLVIMASIIFGFLFGIIIPVWRKFKPVSVEQPRAYKLLGVSKVLTAICMFMGWIGLIFGANSGLIELDFGINWYVKLVLALFTIGTFVFVGMLLFFGWALLTRILKIREVIINAIFLLVFIALVRILIDGNAIGWQF